MNHQLIFIHGRSQEHKDAEALKHEWIAALTEGLEKCGLRIPIVEKQIRFPYYGQTLFDLVKNVPADQVADIVIKGVYDVDDLAKDFLLAVLKEVCKSKGILDAQVSESIDQELREMGPLNWGWIRGILTAIDKHVPGGSGASIALATRDVYEYLNNPIIREKIEKGVRESITPGVPTVVVAHSLGTVVAYSLLKNEGLTQGWNIPLFVTVGSPLGVTAIRRAIQPIRFPSCVTRWYNAMDDRDVVALYPLDADRFGVTPGIENNIRVLNKTENRHGISGYLDDKEVAMQIYNALTA